MKKSAVTLLAITLVLALAMTACVDVGDNDARGREVVSTGDVQTEDKILVVTKDADLNTMDPQYATDELSFEAIAAVLDGLYTADEKGVVIPALAQNTQISDDGLTYTFTIRDAKWSNGDPITAKDFVYAWRRLADPNLASEYNYMIDVAGIKNGAAVLNGAAPLEKLGVAALDDKTFVVVLDRPVPFFLKLVSLPFFYPTNQVFAESKGAQYGLTPDAMLYNGAFVWTEWLSGDSFTIMKNPDYWNANNVKIDGVEFKVVKDAQDAVLDYELGNTNYVYLTGELVDAYKTNVDYHNELGSYLWFLQICHYSGKFDNPNLNKAIGLAYNRKQIANNVLKDGAIPAYFFVPQGLAFDKDGKDFRESVGNYYEGSKEDAKIYWEKAKRELGIDSFGFELLFEDSESSKKVAEFIKSEIELTLEGMSVTLKSQPKKTRLQIMAGQEPDYDIALTRWGPDYADPMTYLELYEAKPDDDLGRGGYNDATYNELIALAKSGTQTEHERWQTMVAAEQQLLDSGMGPLPVYQMGNARLWNSNIKNLYNNPVGVTHFYKWVDLD